MYIVYGLPYCDATKLGMAWLTEHKLPFVLHDYKTQGIAAEVLQRWCNQKGWEAVLNKRSTTWRSLSPAVQGEVTNQEKAIDTMLANTSLVKRPVVELNEKVVAIGYNEKDYAKAFGK